MLAAVLLKKKTRQLIDMKIEDGTQKRSENP